MSSASGGFVTRPPSGLCPCPWTPLGDFRPSDPLFCRIRCKFLATPLIATDETCNAFKKICRLTGQHAIIPELQNCVHICFRSFYQFNQLTVKLIILSLLLA